MAAAHTAGAPGRAAAGSTRAPWAPESDRKSNQRLSVAGSSESMWVPLVNVNHLWAVPVKCGTRLGQWGPVCSSVHWQGRNTGGAIRLTNFTGERGSATFGA